MNTQSTRPLGLSDAQIMETAPAVFTRNHKMSSMYQQIHTCDVIDAFAAADYYPVMAKQQKPTRRDYRYTSHVVHFRHARDIEKPIVGGECLQALLWNSHNGRTKLRLYAGIYRFVCSNGLVIGQDTFTHAAMHTGDAVKIVNAFVTALTERLGLINEVIDAWRAKQLPEIEQVMFAQRAKVLRWGESCPYDTAAILMARRAEDNNGSLWNVFNRVQENCMKGGMEGQSATGRRLVARPIIQAERSIEFNKALWELAEEYAVA